jgi:hypothetical protein
MMLQSIALSALNQPGKQQETFMSYIIFLNLVRNSFEFHTVTGTLGASQWLDGLLEEKL